MHMQESGKGMEPGVVLSGGNDRLIGIHLLSNDWKFIEILLERSGRFLRGSC